MTPTSPTPSRVLETRLALDRFLLGIWTDRVLLDYVGSGERAAAPLAGVAGAASLDRVRAAERLRRDLFGRDRPDEPERLEALLREGVDRAERGQSLLPELAHDLMAHVDAVGRGDPRREAVSILAQLAAASQVNVSIQVVGKLAEASTDRVARARADAVRRLRETLAPLPHLAPRS